MKITFAIITLNEEQNLGRCLQSIRGVADEIVIVDSGGVDGTRSIAAAFGATWHEILWPGYVRQKNNVLALASHEWVFSIDAVEALSAPVALEIQRIKNAGVPENIAGFSVPRCVFYEGSWIRHGDWYPDRLVRLFRRSFASFTGGRVHERLEMRGPVSKLAGELEHHSFQGLEDHRQRWLKYARLWSEDKASQGRSDYWVTPFVRAGFRWFRGFVLKHGFLDGKRGWTIACMSAREVFLKYSFLRVLQASASQKHASASPVGK